MPRPSPTEGPAPHSGIGVDATCDSPHTTMGHGGGETTWQPLPALYVRSQTRRYEQATPEQVLEAARLIVDRRTQRGISFSDPTAACRFFMDRLASREREVFVAAMLDTRHRLIEYTELFLGTVDGAEVHPRELVRHALRINATAVIVAHNHPSGETEPSTADRAVTARLKQALALVGIRLLDHVIVGGNRTLSLAASGWV